MKQSTVFSIILVVFATATVLNAAGSQAVEGVVNINTADAEQLQLLPRVGPALAARIIDFREANGAFRSVDEIVAVKGIGEQSLAKLEPYLVTEGKTTLVEKISLPRSSDGDTSDK